ncbi:MAG TPA: radical SAM family heme chaperone HemW [Candidatus Binatus sp.]|uniref:radical SAM family heme chaperone HemW n=1 Tax=Candidatus Binatus sp. TaxID=2811406 RepID=UPI002B49B4AE|nr:radical SAM family heme chaperone HemW [Candidatus Binatus sp.]HKN12397.1 radical SAM family heme chaperone HemW [Candidatus Binatus sp.]
MSFSLYIHIPWCQSKCPYCDFNSHAASSWPEEQYTRALISELEYRARTPLFSGQRIKTIFFGGGTPSLFQPKSIGEIIEAVNRVCGTEDDAEITLEANPGTVDFAKLAGMRAAGVNRISFGAQSFNQATLKFLGRIHSADETRAAARMAHRAGFDRLNLDLIFAVPGQTVADVLFDIESVAALEPDHISAYNLTFEEGTAFFTELKRGRIKQLATDKQAAMYQTVREEIPRRGYAMYEISNYAAPGHEARHNLTYWRGQTYLGIGAGAHSYAGDGRGGRRCWNEKLPACYIAAIEERANAETGAETIDEATAQSEFVFLNLRLREGFALADFHERFGRNFECIFGRIATPLFNHGLLTLDRGRIKLTDRGLEMADSVFAEFV